MQAALTPAAPIARSDVERLEALIRTIEGVAQLHPGKAATLEALADAAALRRLLDAVPPANVAGFA